MDSEHITGDAEFDASLTKYLAARDELHALIRQARREGMTLRRIASSVGLSVETVRQITLKESQ